jgi:hypothetical protein
LVRNKAFEKGGKGGEDDDTTPFSKQQKGVLHIETNRKAAQNSTDVLYIVLVF